MMPSITLLSMLITLLHTLNVSEFLILGNTMSWLLNLSLTWEILWTQVGSGLPISVLGKLSLFPLLFGKLVLLKCMGLSLVKNHFLCCLDCFFLLC